jgi:hypothetical protein
MPRMPSTRRRRHRPTSALPRPRRIAVLAALVAVTAGVAGCSGDDDGPTASGTVSTAATAPTATGAVSDKAAWAAHRPVPAGFTRMASAKLSIAVPDSYQAVNDPARLGTTDLAATNTKGGVIAARVIPIPEGQTVPDEGPAWGAAGDVARQAEAAKGKKIAIVDADVDGQDGWRVTWISPASGQVPELKHVWSLVDIDDKSFAIVSVQAEPAEFSAGGLDKIGDTLVIRGVTDGTAPSPTATKN